jgi:hypothetical protein
MTLIFLTLLVFSPLILLFFGFYTLGLILLAGQIIATAVGLFWMALMWTRLKDSL